MKRRGRRSARKESLENFMRTLFALLGVAYFSAGLLWPFFVRDFFYITLLPDPAVIDTPLEAIIYLLAVWLDGGKWRSLGIQFSLGAASFLCFYLANLMDNEEDE